MGKRLVIAVPCHTQFAAGFGISLAALYGELRGNPPADLDFVGVHYVQGSILPQGRIDLVKIAQERKATHMLWLDSDMRFPKDAAHRLLAADKDIVAANYIRRVAPYTPTAQSRVTRNKVWSDDRSGVDTEADLVGMGCMMVNMKVYDAIPKPWYTFVYYENGDHFIGEDFYFLENARKAGFPLHIDHDLSKEVEHIGEFGFDMGFGRGWNRLEDAPAVAAE